MDNFMGFIAEPFYLITAFAFIILMMILLLMPQPKGKEWQSFRNSMQYVKVAFGIMTLLNIVQCIDRESPPHEYSILILIIAYYQALCFTMCFLRLLDPHSKLHKFTIHLVWVTVGAVVVLSTLFISSPVFDHIAYWVYFASYICTGLYYTYLCRTGWGECVTRLADYYDDDVFDRMRWLRRLMWTVFGVGVLALATSIWVEINPVFVIVYTLAYTYFLICIIRYAFCAKFIVRTAANNDVPSEAEEVKIAEKEEQEKAEEEQPSADVKKTTSLQESRELQLAVALEQWVADKQYTNSDVAIEETARQLGTTYSFLSSYFQKTKGITFREWRTNLRVEEAKRLLREDMALSISDVLDQSGFNDRANFHRHFTRIVGCSPSAYRANSQDSSK